MIETSDVKSAKNSGSQWAPWVLDDDGDGESMLLLLTREAIAVEDAEVQKEGDCLELMELLCEASMRPKGGS